VLTAVSGLKCLRPYYTQDSRELFRVLLNATSAAEAALALDVLGERVPEKPLVSACNLREVLRDLPRSPFTMAVDEDTLIRTAGMDKHIAALQKSLPDGIELVVTTAGNLVLDLIVKHRGEKYFVTPIPVVNDFVNPSVVDLIVRDDNLLVSIIDLVECMGLVFNPKFYMSLEDFSMEYAPDTFSGLGSLLEPPYRSVQRNPDAITPDMLERRRP